MSSPATAATNPKRSPVSQEPLLSVQNLTKHFPIRKGFWGRQVGAVQAVKEVSFDVQAGETLGLVGESGCGKSTLGRCILQLLKPSAGQVHLAPAEGSASESPTELSGLSNRQLRPLRKRMQMIFQNPYASLNPRLSIQDTLAEPLLIHRLAKGPGLQKRLHTLLNQVGLPASALKKYPHEFSGGQRQRIGIARALTVEPELIVADEPVSALDVSVQAQILNLLRDLREELGLTYLFIAHNLDVVRYISERVAVMYLGSIVELAPVEALYTRPKHPYTQALLAAAPVANVKEARERLAQRQLLEGELPSPANPPSGCRFHTRCPYVVGRCKSEVPALQPVNISGSSAAHWVACHRSEELETL